LIGDTPLLGRRATTNGFVQAGRLRGRPTPRNLHMKKPRPPPFPLSRLHFLKRPFDASRRDQNSFATGLLPWGEKLFIVPRLWGVLILVPLPGRDPFPGRGVFFDGGIDHSCKASLFPSLPVGRCADLLWREPLPALAPPFWRSRSLAEGNMTQNVSTRCRSDPSVSLRGGLYFRSSGRVYSGAHLRTRAGVIAFFVHAGFVSFALDSPRHAGHLGRDQGPLLIATAWALVAWLFY